MDEPDENDISQTIWQLFGKNKRDYTSRDVFSDDEDMEADASALEREEKFRWVFSLSLFFFSYYDSFGCLSMAF
jgi:hypothetical protein